MNSLKSISLDIGEKLKDRAYRSAFFKAWAQDEVALQIKWFRKKRNLRQVDLAEKTGMKQSAVSRLEQAEYSRWNFFTLLRLAEALDARVRVILEPAEDVIAKYEKHQKTRITINTVEAFHEQTRQAENNARVKPKQETGIRHQIQTSSSQQLSQSNITKQERYLTERKRIYETHFD